MKRGAWRSSDFCAGSQNWWGFQVDKMLARKMLTRGKLRQGKVVRDNPGNGWVYQAQSLGLLTQMLYLMRVFLKHIGQHSRKYIRRRDTVVIVKSSLHLLFQNLIFSSKRGPVICLNKCKLQISRSASKQVGFCLFALPGLELFPDQQV